LLEVNVRFPPEARVPIVHFQVPYVEGGSILQIAPFFDSGSGWNTGQPTPSINVLSSVGVGLDSWRKIFSPDLLRSRHSTYP